MFNKRRNKREGFKPHILAVLILMAILLTGCSKDAPWGSQALNTPFVTDSVDTVENTFDINNVPAFSGNPYIAINDNKPYFTKEELVAKSYERYSDLDSLGRCGITIACIGYDIMPTTDRESIGAVKPTGWQTIKYEFVDGKYLYNRCHLIGFQLTGENANVKNLITGTRYMNVEGMLPFENMVADYILETNNHVMYRVIPIYDENNLVANGVTMEAYSVEDNGDGIYFNVYVYNNQPGVNINYATGESTLDSGLPTAADNSLTQETENYILNTNTMKFHKPSCSSVSDISDANKQEYTGARYILLKQGYEPCGSCHP